MLSLSFLLLQMFDVPTFKYLFTYWSILTRKVLGSRITRRERSRKRLGAATISDMIMFIHVASTFDRSFTFFPAIKQSLRSLLSTEKRDGRVIVGANSNK